MSLRKHCVCGPGLSRGECETEPVARGVWLGRRYVGDSATLDNLIIHRRYTRQTVGCGQPDQTLLALIIAQGTASFDCRSCTVLANFAS